MPSKYIAKNPRVPKVNMEDRAELARRAAANAASVQEANRRLYCAVIKTCLKGVNPHVVVDVLMSYLQVDEVRMIATDLKAKQRKSDALATQNRSRQAT